MSNKKLRLVLDMIEDYIKENDEVFSCNEYLINTSKKIEETIKKDISLENKYENIEKEVNTKLANVNSDIYASSKLNLGSKIKLIVTGEVNSSVKIHQVEAASHLGQLKRLVEF